MDGYQAIDLSGQSVLVTGASSGIGRAVAVYLSQLGARLVLIGRDRARLAETLSMMSGGPHRLEVFDLNHVHEVDSRVAQIVRDFGQLSGLVTSAAIVGRNPFRYQTIEEAEAVMRVNWLSVWAMTKAFRVPGRHTRPAAVVYISSVAADVGSKALSAYSASKGALHSMARALAAELADEGIRVNCVAPGFVRSPMAEEFFARITPEQRENVLRRQVLGLGEPRDVATAVAFLISPASRWVTGSVMYVDGGYSAVH